MSVPGPPRDEDREGALEDERSADDRDEGWGEAPPDDDDRYLRERPPHWG